MKEADEARCSSSKTSAEMSSSKSVSSKHPVTTPLRKKNKSTKHKKEEDVHSFSPVTPTRSREGIQVFTSPPSPGSPYSSFSSQDVPEVTWDYSSPKYPEGVTREERNITIQDLTRSLSMAKKALRNQPHPVAPMLSPVNPSTKLLEKWISKDYFINIPANPQPKAKKLMGKKTTRSHNEIMELMEYLACPESSSRMSDKTEDPQSSSLAKENESKSDGAAEGPDPAELPVEEPDLKSKNGDEEDSADELWGVDDPSFIVRATQLSIDVENEISNMSTELKSPQKVFPDPSVVSKTMVFQENSNSNSADVPYCPVQESIGVEFTKCGVFDKSETTDLKYSFPRKKLTFFSNQSSKQSHISNPSLSKSVFNASSSSSSRNEESHLGITIDYAESCSGNSLNNHSSVGASGGTIPGKFKDRKYTFSKKINSDSCLVSKNKQSDESKSPITRTWSSQSVNVGTSCEKQSLHGCENRDDSEACVLSNTSVPQQNCTSTSNTKSDTCNLDSTLEAFDDPIIFAPEVLSWLDEVESQAFSQAECSPEEIAQKKAAALKRRQQKQFMRKEK